MVLTLRLAFELPYRDRNLYQSERQNSPKKETLSEVVWDVVFFVKRGKLKVASFLSTILDYRKAIMLNQINRDTSFFSLYLL